MVEVQQILIEQMNEIRKIIAAMKETIKLITDAVNYVYTLKLLEEHL